MLENIPNEMKIFRQWIVWRYEDITAKKPTKVPYSAISGRLASVNDPNTWADFDECVTALASGWYAGIGFVLTDDDPFAFIDLDDTQGDKTALDQQLDIFNEFASYSEISPSGSGLHIIVKGSVPSGRRRSHIEVYSNARYMTMTGNVYKYSKIEEREDRINLLWNQLSKNPNSNNFFYNGDCEEIETDAQIIENALKAANGDKFSDLFNGDWQNYYQSQSEADFALIDIIAFYTKNKEQITRIFRQSELGKRDKAKRSDYINYMLNKCFDRMPPPVDTDFLKTQIEEAINKKKANISGAMPNISGAMPNISGEYQFPPGLVGEIAQFIYAQAPRPVYEIALAGALGLMSGIVGRAYNVSGTGLNQYVLLLAPTGTGKEAIASGIDKLMAHVIRTQPEAVNFIGPSEISSSPAVIKYMSRGPTSFVSMVGEFGLYLQQMANINAPAHLLGLRRFLLDAYNKSGQGKILRPSIYSDKEKNTVAIKSPAFSLLGESTPEKFYEGLHEGLISEGLLPRFTMIEYHGQVPPLNKAGAIAQPSFELIEKLSTLCAHSLMLNSQDKTITIEFGEGVETMSDKFEEHCRNNVNSSDRDVKRQLWSRAHMKALKLAGIVAIGCNPYNPVISSSILSWAIELAVSDTRNLLARFNAGEIGIDNDETKQLAKLISITKDFILKPWPEVEVYAGKGMSSLHSHKILPYSYIQRRLVAVAVFRKDRQGSTFAIKRAIKTLCERGDIQELPKGSLFKEHGAGCLAYAITNQASILA